MFDFLVNNAGTIIISAALLVILCFAVISIMKDKKKGKCSCGGNCGSCGMNCACRKK
jgi:hypothetical protein